MTGQNELKGQLKRILSKWPVLYRMGIIGSLRYRFLKEYLLGSRVRERQWATRHLHKDERMRDDWGNGCDDWIRGYRDSTDHPHRQILIEIISKYNPSNILEIGCNCGPNLYLLGKKFPNAEIIGIDINPLAVQKGNEWFVQESILNVKLLQGKADELVQFRDESFDVVFTDAVLIYIGPDIIKRVIMDMIRVTRHVLILIEWHGEDQRRDPDGLGVYYRGNWKRDYITLLKNFVDEEQIHVTKITQNIWPEKTWKEIGAIIEVRMEHK